MKPDEDDLEDYPHSLGYGISGRGTPMGSRKTPNALSMPPERKSVTGYERPRAQTEGTVCTTEFGGEGGTEDSLMWTST
jgi:cell division control protein 24